MSPFFQRSSPPGDLLFGVAAHHRFPEIFSSWRSALQCHGTSLFFRDLLLPEIFSLNSLSVSAKGCSPAWGPNPSIHTSLDVAPDQLGFTIGIKIPTSHLFSAANVAPLWCLLLHLFGASFAVLDRPTGSDEPNKHCHDRPMFMMARIKSNLIVRNNPQPDLLS